MDAKKNQQTKPLSDCRYPDISVRLLDVNGNALALAGATMKALKDANVPPSEISKFHAEALSGDYQHVLQTILSWVAVDTTEEHDLDATDAHDNYDFEIYEDDWQSLDSDKFEFSLAGYIEPTEEYYLKDIRFYHRLIHSALKEGTVSVDKIKDYMARIDKNEADLDELRERIARLKSFPLPRRADVKPKACGE